MLLISLTLNTVIRITNSVFLGLYKDVSLFIPSSNTNTHMNGRTFLLSRDSTLRTTLIDEVNGQAVYEVDTPRKLSSSYVTKIRKLDPAARPRICSDDDDPDSEEETADRKCAFVGTEEDEPLMELPETSDEIARIYWKLASPDRIIYRGKITTQKAFLPECGKMKG